MNAQDFIKIHAGILGQKILINTHRLTDGKDSITSTAGAGGKYPVRLKIRRDKYLTTSQGFHYL